MVRPPVAIASPLICVELQGTESLLDGLERRVEEGTGMHQYFIKLVPTVNTPLSGM